MPERWSGHQRRQFHTQEVVVHVGVVVLLRVFDGQCMRSASPAVFWLQTKNLGHVVSDPRTGYTSLTVPGNLRAVRVQNYQRLFFGGFGHPRPGKQCLNQKKVLRAAGALPDYLGPLIRPRARGSNPGKDHDCLPSRLVGWGFDSFVGGIWHAMLLWWL